MSPRLRLLHAWTRQVTSLLPDIRVTQARTLALFVLGVVWAGRLPLRTVAATLPLAVADASSEQRLRRWLVNDRVCVADLWRRLLPTLLASRAGQEVLLVLDPTPLTARVTVVMLGLVCRRRVLPVAWRVLPQQTRWPTPQIDLFRQLLAEVAAALPEDCTVTVVGDRALPSAAVIDACRAVGFHALFRLSADTEQGYVVRRDGDAAPVTLWSLVTGPGQRWHGAVALFKAAGWRRVDVTIHWQRDQTAPWLLVSTRAGGGARVREYRRRAHAEATYADCKRRGWDVEASRITQLDRLNRVLLVLHLAYWWTTQLGLRVLRHGDRRRYDRAGRRDLSIVRIGRAALADHLDRCSLPPPLPFRRTASGWTFTWLA
jgi:hypothetical protein